MSKRLMTLRSRLAAVKDKAREITATADAAGIDLTDAENEQIDAFLTEAGGLQASIEREEHMADLDRAADAIPAPGAQPAPGAAAPGAQANEQIDPMGGFHSYGEFAGCVMQANLGNGTDDRLIIGAAAPTTYGNESSGADGGFLVPTEFQNNIRTHSLTPEAFMPLTDNTPINGNSMVFPRDETTPWGTNGVRAYWEGEAAVATQTKPVIGTDTLRLRKLMALVPVTDELLSDSSALSSFLTKKTGESILWKTNDALLNGTGAGMPLGIRNSSALVTVPKESGQGADTVLAQNIVNMYARMPAASMLRSVWIVNNDVLPQIMLLTLANQPIYLPPNGLAGAPLGTLLGRPIMISQSSQTLGDAGDIMFVDWNQYNTVSKAGGVEYATSIHLFFDAGATAFRATYRVDGQPWLKGPIVPANGVSNLSPFIDLAVRA